MKVSQASGKFQAYLESPGNFRSFCSLKFQKVRNGLTKRVLEGLAGTRHAETLERFISQSFGKTFGGFREGCKRFCWK